MPIEQYIDENKNGTGKKGRRDVKGNEHGPFIVVVDESGGVLGGSTMGNLKIVTDDIVSGDLTTNAYEFDANVDAVWVVNDDDADITVTISTLGFTIKPGESRVIEMAAFDTVTFSASAVFRMNGLRRG